MDVESFPRAEETVRLLATAAVAARLYPPTSTLPAEATARFVARANEVTGAQGPLRYIVESHALRLGDTELGAGGGQIVALAESLHAMQAGQLIIAPGISEEEAVAVIEVLNGDPAEVRSSGGLRSALTTRGVSHIAVIEVSLRASDEEGLLGIDLATAPLEEIAERTAAAAEDWARDARTTEGMDTMAMAIDRLEEATRAIAMERVSAALMRLDEATRIRVLGMSLSADTSGRRMEGMLAVIARMKPAALARLLKLVADAAGAKPERIAGALQLPPETLKLLAIYLAPTPSLEPDFGVSDADRARDMAREMAVVDDPVILSRQVAAAAAEKSSGRSLSTAVALSRVHPDAESVRTIADSLAPAAQAGNFPNVREALRRLDELAADPALTDTVNAARATLAVPSVLADVCSTPTTDADAAIAGEILSAAGTAGAEALLDCYIHAVEPTRSLLRPVLRGMGEGILGVARSRLRTEDARSAIGIVRTLPALGDKRAVPVITQALENFDGQVRFAAVTALAETPAPEARAALVKALNHADPETQRYAIREIGRVRAVEAIPSLSRALEDINFLGRTHDTKKEIISAMEQIGSPDALPVLRRVAGQRILFGWKKKELRFLARRAVEQLTKSQRR